MSMTMWSLLARRAVDREQPVVLLKLAKNVLCRGSRTIAVGVGQLMAFEIGDQLARRRWKPTVRPAFINRRDAW